MRFSSLASKLMKQTRNSLIQRRCYATDPHGEVKYNAWEKPAQISQWKEEHIVFAVLGGWAVAIFTATKVFGGKKEITAAE